MELNSSDSEIDITGLLMKKGWLQFFNVVT